MCNPGKSTILPASRGLTQVFLLAKEHQNEPIIKKLNGKATRKNNGLPMSCNPWQNHSPSFLQAHFRYWKTTMKSPHSHLLSRPNKPSSFPKQAFICRRGSPVLWATLLPFFRPSPTALHPPGAGSPTSGCSIAGGASQGQRWLPLPWYIALSKDSQVVPKC